MQPTASHLHLPPGYGESSSLIAWDAVRQRLADAKHYWLATTRPDGRPHVVPVDGIWLDGAWYFGGHPNTVHQRNLRTNQQIAVHLDDATAVVVVEGRAEWITPSGKDAKRLAAASRAKYGFAPPNGYRLGVWQLRPERVIAWQGFPADATRFTFDGS
jgi:nitroimidazol reductase NimA-like FMN-containing flavoprotein (pyridoxamine 5'-phosphate oxidase superfamily)